MRTIISLLGMGSLLLGLAAVSQAAQPDFVDTFSGTSVNGWTGGTGSSSSLVVINPGAPGADGADGYLQLTLTSPGKFGVKSSASPYLGDWIAAGITSVDFYLNDIGAQDSFEIHFSIADAANNTWQYNPGFSPPHGSWQLFSVEMTNQGIWTPIIGSASFNSVLSSINKVHLRHDAVPFGQQPDVTAGDLAIDNIHLVPEPSTLVLLLICAVALCFRGCRQSKRAHHAA
jgi:hypothetical protein